MCKYSMHAPLFISSARISTVQGIVSGWDDSQFQETSVHHAYPLLPRYRGELDRYDDIGGTGYHVTYDDGDEEVLGMTIEGRDDVRLLPADEDVLSPSEVTKR